MTDQHYTHTCQVCKTEFPATLNKDGSIRKRKYLACSQACYKVAAGLSSGIKRPEHKMKDCAFCGKEFGPMPPGKAKQKTYCSRTCAQSVRKRYALCAYCECEFHQFKHRLKFCCHSCANSYKGYSKAVECEVAALVRIAKARKSYIKRVSSALKKVEAEMSKVFNCHSCNAKFIRRIGFIRYCSEECSAIGTAIKRKKYKQTDKGKEIARKAKSRRKAISRGANGGDRIDPIAVFRRDKWICHLCGVKTISKLRGTHEPLAPELDHIVTIADGGSHTFGNVACACRKCNAEKSSKSLGQIGFGFI